MKLTNENRLVVAENFNKRLSNALKDIFRPKPTLSILEWAETHFSIPAATAARPGRYYSQNAAYQAGILDSIYNNNTTILKTSARIGKTLCQLITVGYYIDQVPCPILFVGPDDAYINDFARRTVEPVIQNNPRLLAKIPKQNKKEGSNTTLAKYFNGGSLLIANAGTPNALTGKYIRVLMLDEVDKYPSSSKQAGDPVSLAIRRTENVLKNHRVVMASTPLGPEGRITTAYESSSQGQYQIRCIHCDELFIPLWEHVHWDKETNNPDTAQLYCPHCGSGHTDIQRQKAVKNGEWIHRFPERKEKGFHLNSLVSPSMTLAEAVEEWFKAQLSSHQMKTFQNEILGLAYEISGERVDDILFAERLEDYSLTSIPNEVLFLTCGVDCQINRLEGVVVGWGKDLENWCIHHFVIAGSPNDPLTWALLHEEIKSKFTRQDGIELKIIRTGIDTGGNDQEEGFAFSEIVRKFCKKNRQYGYLPLKGASTSQKSIFPVRRQKTVNLVDTDKAKQQLYSLLKIEKHGPGFCHFNLQCDAEFFIQLTSEELIITKKDGRVKREWKRIGNRAAEILDCYVYAIAVMYSLGPKYVDLAISKNARQPEPEFEIVPEEERQFPKPKQISFSKNINRKIEEGDSSPIIEPVKVKRTNPRFIQQYQV